LSLISENPSIVGMDSHISLGLRTKPMATHAVPVTVAAQPSAKPIPRLFSGLSDNDITEIMAAAVVRKVRARQTIIRADDPGRHLFVLKTGFVDFYRVTPEGQQILIIRFSPVDAFGYVTLLAKPMGYMGTAETVHDTELYVWEHAWVRHFAVKHPLLIENALRIGLEYIRLYSDRHLALVSHNAEDRLRRTVSLLGTRTGKHHARGLELHITNERLASLADIGYYTTSRLLNKWERKGAVEKSRGKIVIINPESMLDE
jgi:CRP-like cAMP-binding protein